MSFSGDSIMNISIIKGFVQSISRLWKKREFEDFKVIVDGEIFTCHSVILAGVSEFFAGLLRSNMKEQKEMEVRLIGISSSTFQLILNTLYTGIEMLTNENVCDVWSAVHQLQIPFLIEHCEDFVLKTLSLETIEKYKQRAEYLQSEKIKDGIFDFMLTNFESLRTTKMFQELDFQYLTNIISDDKLVVNSEDSVLQAIFDWVDYKNIQPSVTLQTKDLVLGTMDGERPNKEMNEASKGNNSITKEADLSLVQETPSERKELLISLLKSTRCYLASDTCIVRLFNSCLIGNDLLVKELLFKALTFKLYDNWHGHWPTMAIHRDCSEVEHVAVTSRREKVIAISFKQKKMFLLSKLPIQGDSKLVIFRTKLYACIQGRDKNEVFVFQNSVWTLVTEIPHDVLMILSHDKYIYVFDSNEERFTRFDPDILPIKLETFQHEILNITYALSFNNNIVVFASVDNTGEEEETAVHCWNSETQVWTQLDNLKLSSLNMTSFRDDFNTYILDSKGKLWTLNNIDGIGLRLLSEILIGHFEMYGAVLFRKKLFLFKDYSLEMFRIKNVRGVISSNKIWRMLSPTSSYVHYVIAKDYLK